MNKSVGNLFDYVTESLSLWMNLTSRALMK